MVFVRLQSELIGVEGPPRDRGLADIRGIERIGLRGGDRGRDQYIVAAPSRQQQRRDDKDQRRNRQEHLPVFSGPGLERAPGCRGGSLFGRRARGLLRGHTGGLFGLGFLGPRGFELLVHPLHRDRELGDPPLQHDGLFLQRFQSFALGDGFRGRSCRDRRCSGVADTAGDLQTWPIGCLCGRRLDGSRR